MKYKLAVFDMDGTILNTLEDLTNSINYALSVNNMPTHSIDNVRRFVGNGLSMLIERACPKNSTEEQKEQLFRDFSVHYKKHGADNTKPYEGINELLSTLRENGCLTAVVSNKQHAAVLDLVDKYFNGLFDVSFGEIKNVPRKPEPDSVYNVLEKLNIDKKDAVYIGDSDVDILTAKKAGLDSIIVTWGFRDEEFLREMGAKTIVSTTEEIKNIILN